jgi:MFS superfamily sulfate permease-like transporter
MMVYDALLAGLLAGCVTLAVFLFWPLVADQLPELGRMAIVYLAVLFVVSWIFEFWRRRWRK